MAQFTFKRLEWTQADERVRAVNPGMANALQPMSRQLKKRGKDFVYEASYPYGATVIDDGRFLLPKTDAAGSEIDGLGAAVPVAVVLKNAFEVFGRPRTDQSETERDPENANFRPRSENESIRMLQPGDVFGDIEYIFRRLGIKTRWNHTWSVAAGSITA